MSPLTTKLLHIGVAYIEQKLLKALSSFVYAVCIFYFYFKFIAPIRIGGGGYDVKENIKKI